MKAKLLLLTTLIALMFTGCVETAKGTKIGQVVKVNEASGLVYKTVEVEIIRGGFSAGSGAQGGVLDFTIEDKPALVELVKQAMLDGSELEVQYHKEFFTFLRSDSHSVFADDIKLVHPNKSNNTSPEDANNEIIRALILQNEALQKLLKK